MALNDRCVEAGVRTRRRVVVRHRLAGRQTTDVIGLLLRADAEGVTVLPDFGPPVEISGDAVLACKPVPDRVVRPASKLEVVTKLMNAGWPGLERRRLGGWVLMASGGFTGRANCCLPIGDPGLPLPEALGEVEGFFAERNLPAKVQVSSPLGAAPSHLEAELTRRGYTPDTDTLVMVTELRGRGTEPATDGSLVCDWSDHPDERWLEIYRYLGAPLPPTAVDVLTASPGARFGLIARLGMPIGCVRTVVDSGWVGVTAMQIVDEHRRRGFGRQLFEAALNQGVGQGARYAYLQVVRSNTPAIDLYRAAGFTEHHGYCYWTRPARLA